MKHLVLILLITASQCAFAQKPPVQLHAAYFGPFLTHPGLKIGVDVPLLANNNWQVYASPQLGYFSRYNDYGAWLGNAEVGYKNALGSGSSWLGLGIAVGYLGHSAVTGRTVNLQGETTARTRELRSYLLPSANVSYGWGISERLQGYAKIGYGYRYSSTWATSAMLLGELGISFNLSSTTPN